jgi:hypothetical protein
MELNKMKKILFYFCALMLFTTLFTSCRYEEGPYISFLSPETRLVGYWEVGKVLRNGEEYTETSDLAHQKGSYYSFYIERMLEVEAIKDNYLQKSVTGAWDFQNHEKEIYMMFTIQNKKYSYTARIKRLTKYDLEYEYTDENGDVWRMIMNNRSVY